LLLALSFFLPFLMLLMHPIASSFLSEFFFFKFHEFQIDALLDFWPSYESGGKHNTVTLKQSLEANQLIEIDEFSLV
jgi:hypothetical protein